VGGEEGSDTGHLGKDVVEEGVGGGVFAALADAAPVEGAGRVEEVGGGVYKFLGGRDGEEDL
jgi:hypothetical protein